MLEQLAFRVSQGVATLVASALAVLACAALLYGFI